MDSAAEQVFTLMAASIRSVIALLVCLMAGSEWKRTRNELFLHLRTAFLLIYVQQLLLLGATAGTMTIALRPMPFLSVILHALEAMFLLAICHAMAVHHPVRGEAVQSVTRRLSWITVAAAVFTLIWRAPWWESAWETALILLLLLSIYLALLLRPPISVVRSQLILLAGLAAHLAHLVLWGGDHLLLRIAEQFLPAAGTASFLWAVHSGIVRETYTDALTGLHNKRFFLDRMPQELELHNRKGRPLSLIVGDLDHFKNYNDTFGHVEGDRLLQSIASILLRHTRRYDVVCRWGGEEFAVLLPDTNADSAATVAERLRGAIAAAHGGPERRSPVTISAGIATFPQVSGSWEALVEAADSALYDAKRRRNRVVVWR